MNDKAPSCSLGGGRPRVGEIAGLLVILAFGAYLRFEGLGLRSLWRDELCTWHVARMPLGASMAWGPELTKPPLYQLALRLFISDPHPSEAMLRLPAAAFGLLTVVAAWWLGRGAGGRWIGIAAAGLIAVQPEQVFYSREARPYSMLAFGATLMVLLWWRMVVGRRLQCTIAFVAAAVLTLYAHYLAGLILLGCALWWAALWVARPRSRGHDGDDGSRFGFKPAAALVVVGLLCVPLVVRYLAYKSSMFQGLEWISPPSGNRAVQVLSELTLGPQWVFVILLPATMLWIAAAMGRAPRPLRSGGGPLYAGRDDICGLLLACIVAGWGGLVLISWLAHPALVTRYALGAAVPAILLPLVVAFRLDRRAPIVLMSVFAVVAAPQWLDRSVEPGLREMSAYLHEHVDRETEAVVLTIDRTIYPGWEDSERLCFEYYPLRGIPVTELRLGADNVTPLGDTLKDPRGLYLVVLWADEDAILATAGRDRVDFTIDGRSVSRLLFEPYRLMRVAPLE